MCSCGGKFEDILNPVLDSGKYLIKAAKPSEIRKYVLINIKNLPLS